MDNTRKTIVIPKPLSISSGVLTTTSDGTKVLTFGDISISPMRLILQYPDNRLKQKSNDVQAINMFIKSVIKDMEQYLSIPWHLGISAVQLGVPLRIIGIKRNQQVLFLINPVYTKKSEQTYKRMEGCMSVNEGRIQYRVVRHKLVKVRGTDITGKVVTIKGGSDIFGATIQHEIDHLDGKLVLDYPQ